MKRQVLYIEDNDQNFYLVQFILNARGYETVRAATGREGIEMARTAAADIILLDIQLPDMAGYEVAQVLRREQGLTIPIVALTSYAMIGDREKALEAGCVGYIEKPLDPRTFADQIDRFFSGDTRSEHTT